MCGKPNCGDMEAAISASSPSGDHYRWAKDGGRYISQERLLELLTDMPASTLVVDVRDDGTTDPSRAQWLPLFSQRTKPRVEENAENEDAKIEDKNDDAP